MTDQHIDACVPVAISDDDVYEAMKDIQGYLDITPGDFKEVYLRAYQHALQRLTRSVKVSEIMTREVATVSAETPLKTVAEIMSRRQVSGLPVIDLQGKVLGIISDKDFLSHMGDGTARTFMDVVSVEIGVKSTLDSFAMTPIRIFTRKAYQYGVEVKGS